MIKLDPLKHLIENSSSIQPPSESIVEEYFDPIVHCMEQDKIKDATRMIEKVFTAGEADIRLIGYFLYAHFTDHGIKSFTETFPLLLSLFSDHWNLLRPLNKTDKHVQNSLNWYFSEVLRKLMHVEKLQKKGQIHLIWKKSVLEVSEEELGHLTSAIHRFKQFFLEKWPQSSTKEKLLHLVKKIEELKPLIEEQLSSDIEEEKSMEEESTISHGENSTFEEPNQRTQSEEDPFNSEFSSEDFSIVDHQDNPYAFLYQKDEGSSLPTSKNNPEEDACLDRLETFLQKLKIFESLISQNNYLKAAVIARDIDHLIETFDPLNYFPRIFAKYFALFAKHVAALSEQYEKRDSLQVKALEKLYRADLEMFIDW